MHGDDDPDSTNPRSVTVTDTTGGTYTDYDELSGFEYESKTFDGATEISKMIKTPWRYKTGSESHTWGASESYFVNTASTRGYTALAAGGWRQTKTSTTLDTTYGQAYRTENEGDVNVTGDEACTRTTYVTDVTTYTDNKPVYVKDLVSQVESVSVTCSATPNRATQVISDDRTYYDAQVLGKAKVTANATRTERLATHDGTTATYTRVAEGTFDGFGRLLTAKDALGEVTTTSYVETNGLTTRVTEKSPLGYDTVTTYAPAWGSPTQQVDPNGMKSVLEYDPLGRLSKVWMPDRTGVSGLTPNTKYTYLIRTDKPAAVKTEQRRNDGTYTVEYQLYDSLLRPRQLQTCSWRIESDSDFLVACEDHRDHIRAAVPALDGRTLTSVHVSRFLDLTFRFADLRLVVFTATSTPSSVENWSVQLPSGEVLFALSGVRWSLC